MVTEKELQDRTKTFALRVVKLVAALPNTAIGRQVGGQLLRSATSVGANYRAACRGHSKREFIAKLCIVEEEADECAYWLELIIDGGVMGSNRVGDLLKEANEILAIIIASRKTASRRCKQ